MKNICYIIGANNANDVDLHPTKDDYVIAADAGYTYVNQLSVNADLVVGDFDSLGKRPDHPNIVEHPSEKDDTDMMLAIKEGLKRGYRTFVLYGGLGGQLDHTYANIQALAYLAEHDAAGYLLGDGLAITAIKNNRMHFDSNQKGMVSIFCNGKDAHGVNLKGLKFELTDALLTASMPLGVRNEFIGNNSEISVIDGVLVIMWHENPTSVIGNIKEATV